MSVFANCHKIIFRAKDEKLFFMEQTSKAHAIIERLQKASCIVNTLSISVRSLQLLQLAKDHKLCSNSTLSMDADLKKLRSEKKTLKEKVSESLRPVLFFF